MSSCATALIDLKALEHNFYQVQQFAPKSKILAMIKGNGYGHGLITVAKTLQNADALGVANVMEGMRLREAGINSRVVIMRGFADIEELKLIAKYNFDTVIHCQEQLDILAANKLLNKINAWLKVDSGMHRLGFLPEQLEAAYKQLLQNADIADPIQLLTHFSTADEYSSPATKAQLEVFNQCSATIVTSKSLANSAAIINYPQTHAEWIRPGIVLYGASPMADKTGLELNLKPVMTLQAQLIAIRQLRKGDAVGYGGTWQCPEDMAVGVVAIGYGDGYPRHAKSGTPVLINGKICQLVGRVSMDMITVDLRNCPQVQYGDMVTLWGKGLPIEHVAVASDTIAYELLCSVTRRVKFVY